MPVRPWPGPIVPKSELSRPSSGLVRQQSVRTFLRADGISARAAEMASFTS